MHEVESGQFKSQRRRSERVSQPLPLVVRGIDLLGQPFEERTVAQVYNLHGCRYSSKHHLQQNVWITIETERCGQPENVRARVAWTQRPQSIRDFFQVGVELERPANIWGLESPPEDWRVETPAAAQEHAQQNFIRNTEDVMSDIPFDSPLRALFASPSGQQSPSGPESPAEESGLLRNLNEELRRQARAAVEAAAARVTDDIRASLETVHQQRLASSEAFFQTWKEEFARAQRGEVEPPVSSGELTSTQEDFLNALKLKFEDRFSEARQLIEELDQKARSIRTEAEAVGQEAARPGQARSRAEEANLPTAEQLAAQSARWNERVDLEMSLAQSQWNELLQSSLDGGVQRLAAHLSEQSKDMLRTAELRLAERFEELRQPLSETAVEARQMVVSIRSELEQEMALARNSLVDIEQVAGRIKDYSTQLEASSHDTLNELHQRLENILEAQTDQLNRHADQLLNGLTDRLNPAVETLGRQLVERTIAEIEAKVAPRLERVPELIRELSAREMQAEDSLRLHRERLRQATDSNQREVAAQMAVALSNLRNDFDSAGKEMVARCAEELRESGSRASQAASEAIGQSSEWFQGETRARLQVLLEQSLATANNNLDDLASQSARKHAENLEQQSATHLAEAGKVIDGATAEALSRGRSQLDEAAQAAAASFGQVLRDLSGAEMEQFTVAARNAVQERAKDFEGYAQQALGTLSTAADASVDAFRARMASEIETAVSQGRDALGGELNSLRDRFAVEREARQKEWAEGLENLSHEATAKHEERLQGACDAWIVSSVRRLNEHGQSTLESLMRFTDQALRDSCSKVFEGLAQLMRDRNANAAAASAFVPIPSREPAENSAAQ